MMRCDQAEDYLNDYVDGLLQEELRLEVGEHLGGCPKCRAEEEALRNLLDETRNLPEEIQPDQDLWSGIQARIEGRVVEFPQRPRRGTAILRYALPVAAAVLVLVSAGLYVNLGEIQVPAPTPVPVQVNTSANTEDADARVHEAKEKLLEALRAQEDTLSPEVIAAVEESLAVIENAISDLQMALLDDPENPHLENMLIAVYESEMGLLEQALRLVSKG